MTAHALPPSEIQAPTAEVISATEPISNTVPLELGKDVIVSGGISLVRVTESEHRPNAIECTVIDVFPLEEDQSLIDTEPGFQLIQGTEGFYLEHYYPGMLTDSVGFETDATHLWRNNGAFRAGEVRMRFLVSWSGTADHMPGAVTIYFVSKNEVTGGVDYYTTATVAVSALPINTPALLEISLTSEALDIFKRHADDRIHTIVKGTFYQRTGSDQNIAVQTSASWLSCYDVANLTHTYVPGVQGVGLTSVNSNRGSRISEMVQKAIADAYPDERSRLNVQSSSGRQ